MTISSTWCRRSKQSEVAPLSRPFATAQKLPAKDTRNAMNTNDRRLIVDHGFDCTVETVIDAFLREGLTVTPVGGGDLRQHSAVGDALRYAVLEATLPELAFDVGRRRADVDARAQLPDCGVRARRQMHHGDSHESCRRPTGARVACAATD